MGWKQPPPRYFPALPVALALSAQLDRLTAYATVSGSLQQSPRVHRCCLGPRHTVPDGFSSPRTMHRRRSRDFILASLFQATLPHRALAEVTEHVRTIPAALGGRLQPATPFQSWGGIQESWLPAPPAPCSDPLDPSLCPELGIEPKSPSSQFSAPALTTTPNLFSPEPRNSPKSPDSQPSLPTFQTSCVAAAVTGAILMGEDGF